MSNLFIDTLSIGAGSLIKPARTEEASPSTFRFAQYPDGSKRLQGGYRYIEGFEGGTVWRDLPCVMVDETGQEIPI